MNFFKTVFSDEPESPPSHNSDSDQPDPDHHDTPTETTAWSFGGLIQTLASKSESVLENYRRDLEEFSSGLKIETSVIREAASRAVKDLPASLDVGASVAQESLETVGQAIDDIGSTVWKSTAQIISHGRESLLAPDSDSDSNDSNNIKRDLSSSSSVGDLKRYSRFDVLVRALQSDVNTYLDEPEDLVNFNEWKLGFVLDDKVDEIENLIKENDVVDEIYVKIVPSKIDDEIFWSRYFYKLHKLKQAEDARAKFVKRAISGDEEEDLSWDFDDDDNNDDGYEPKGSISGVSKQEDNSAEVAATTVDANVEIVKNLKIENDEKGVAAAESITDRGDDKLEKENYVDNVVSSVSATVSDQDDKLDIKNVASEVKADNDNSGESCKDSDISIVSSQPSMPEEEDISWDEIEDVETNDEKRGDAGASESKIDLQKRLSAATADEDEDLSWDIEEDDEAVKS
ncbi:BSD domain-containing protein 1 [Medicago truncatula]|uniref:Synapse-associated protein, putative n=1 Tax=Medicago truncatula TaxID=3880 RepID=G7IFQ3_MEDTR|nr:BSD domain-containing protein 1 [Medicago truncatula]AES64328.1 synapse-associated protein, putative [Medicago truncatula]